MNGGAPGASLELAARAVPGAATCDARLLDRMTAAWARLVGLAVHTELRLHRAFRTVRRSVVAQSRSLARDAEPQRAADRLDESAQLLAAHFMARPERMEPRPPERLVCVDVPHASEDALVEDDRLQRSLP